MSDFDDLGVFENLAMPSFLWHRACGNWSSDWKTTTSGMEALGVISLTVNRFPIEIPAKLEMLPVNRDNQVIGKHSYFKKGVSFWITMAWIRKNLCMKITLDKFLFVQNT
jgi:hypothetical protein